MKFESLMVNLPDMYETLKLTSSVILTNQTLRQPSSLTVTNQHSTIVFEPLTIAFMRSLKTNFRLSFLHNHFRLTTNDYFLTILGF